MTEAGSGTPSIEVGELLSRGDAGEPLLLLDVRNDEEFATWRFEGRHALETVHIPYFDFIEDAEGSTARLPRNREIVVLWCSLTTCRELVGCESRRGEISRSPL